MITPINLSLCITNDMFKNHETFNKYLNKKYANMKKSFMKKRLMGHYNFLMYLFKEITKLLLHQFIIILHLVRFNI